MIDASSIPANGRRQLLRTFGARYKAWDRRAGAIPTVWPGLSYGAPGLAYALALYSEIDHDICGLELADFIIDTATQAFDDLTPPSHLENLLRSTSLFHSISGLWWARAIIKNRVNDVTESAMAVAKFCDRCTMEDSNLDLFSGAGSLLLGCIGLIFELGSRSDITRLHEVLEVLVKRLLTAASEGDVSARRPFDDYNFAHGWAGALYALLRASPFVSMPILEHVHERAHDLLKVGNVDNRGIMTWPQREHAKSWGSASWCNGSAGHTFFWLEAAMCYGDAGFLRVAEDSAFVSGETVQQRGPSVCCGYAGQAYSVFAAARSSAETIWYARGLELAELAARNVNSREMNTPERHSLFSGEAGVALLCAAIGEGHAPVLPVIEHGITPIARPHCNNSEREKGSSF